MVTAWWIVAAFAMGGCARVFLAALLLAALSGRQTTDQVIGL